MTDERPMPDVPSDKSHLSENAGVVADAATGNWVDKYAPVWSRPYLRLSRLDRPTGWWLLLLPCWWGVLLAAGQNSRFDAHTVWVMFGCLIGAILMRGAGCTWNDITDREFDAAVERTKSRPIPSGQISVKKALLWTGIQCAISLAILLSFGKLAIIIAFIAMVPVVIYPFAKRFTNWPQLVLGIAFNAGAIVAYAAETGHLTGVPFMVYFAGIAWTLFYDTIYAHQDKEDDALIGVKSTARLFGDNTPIWLKRFLVVTVLFFAAAVIDALAERSIWSLTIGLAAAWGMGVHMTWQMLRLNIDDPDKCLAIFRSNRDAGLIAALFLAIAAFV